jgi:hypothetical protein
MPIVNGVQTAGQHGRAHHLGEPLTCDEIRSLPDGAEIVVTWDGGNGPHPYRVLVDFEGRRRIEGLYCDEIIADWYTMAPLHRVTVGWDDETRAWAEAAPTMPDHIRERWAAWRGRSSR